MLRYLGLVLLVGFGSIGCGAAEPDHSSAPACGDVWVKGEVFPDEYEGCLFGARFEEPDVLRDCTKEGGGITYRHFVTGGFLVGDHGYEVVFHPTSGGADGEDKLYGYYFGCEQPD